MRQSHAQRAGKNVHRMVWRETTICAQLYYRKTANVDERRKQRNKESVIAQLSQCTGARGEIDDPSRPRSGAPTSRFGTVSARAETPRSSSQLSHDAVGRCSRLPPCTLRLDCLARHPHLWALRVMSRPYFVCKGILKS